MDELKLEQMSIHLFIMIKNDRFKILKGILIPLFLNINFLFVYNHL